MFSDIFPPGVQGPGTTLVIAVTSITSFTTPALTEVNAISSIDITPYFQAGNPFAPTHTQAKTDDTRMSDAVVREAFGRSTFASDALRVIYDPQGTDVAGNKAYFALTPGTTKYLVVRYGLPTTTAPAASQKVDIFKAVFGNRHKLTPGNGDDSKHLTEQQVAITRVGEDAVLT